MIAGDHIPVIAGELFELNGRTIAPSPLQSDGMAENVGVMSTTGLITTLAEAKEVQPAAFVTVKVYVPAARAVIVALAPEPVVVPPGILVKVQFPVAGSPVKTTLPVGIEQVGWVLVPTIGAVGTTGAVLITTFADGVEVHPAVFVTVNV